MCGSSSSEPRAHSGTGFPALSASHTTSPQRSTRRRRGAVTCAYGAASAACVDCAGGVPSKAS